MVSPCPCTSLQTGTKIVAIIDAILNGLILALLILTFVGILALDPERYDVDITSGEKTQIIAALVIAIIIAICQLSLALYLKRSANESYYRGCKKWLIVTLVLFILGIVSVGITIGAGGTALDITVKFIGIAYRIYAMFVVFSFMKELNSNGGFSNSYSNGIA